MRPDAKPLTKVLGAFGVAAGLGLGVAGIAAATTGPSSSPEAPASADEGATLKARAKVTPEQAKQTALAAVPGSVSDVELDNEHGRLVYSVEVAGAGRSTDVTVDAGDGKVLTQEPGSAEAPT